MKYAAVVTAACLASLSRAGNAQELAGLIPSEFDAISESVVRIRTVTGIQYNRVDPESGRVLPPSPYSIDGSGVVVGELMVEGQREYLVLTNHHVADASNYVRKEDGYLRMNPRNTEAVPRVAEESFLIVPRTRSGEEPPATRLIELVRWVEGDMALMRTDGVDRPLTVFDGTIGYADGELEPGAQILTSGYPWGGRQIVAAGTILQLNHPHPLGLPHSDFLVDVPVEPGQSGGPIFLVEEDRQRRRTTLRLIGLVHARDENSNYGVTYREWLPALDDFPAELRGRMVGLN